MIVRSLLLVALALLPSLAAAQSGTPVVLFVHGNGDSSALWHTTIWRLESNGWNRTRLFAVNLPHPTARSDDTKPQENRSSTEEQMRHLAATVAEIQARVAGERLVLVGSSRGANTIRNFLKNGGGAARVSHAILCGGTNHGVWADPALNPNSEFNGSSAFMIALNTPDEVVPGVKYLTIRSDSNDKYAQPDARFIGRPGQPTNITSTAPELRGATNVVLPRLDHREVCFHRLAFKTMHAFLTGREPAALEPTAETRPVLNGFVDRYVAGAPTNLGLAGATVEIYEVDPATGRRLGSAVHAATTGDGGVWGPFTAQATAYYEFVARAPGLPTTHTYRTPFPRSTAHVHLRLQPLDDKDRGTVRLYRPRGYLGHGRDTFTIDGVTAEGVNDGVPGADRGSRKLDGPSRTVRVVLNGETLSVLSRPAEDAEVVVAEFHH
jgi:pimeloyl-ACP methyl ester carboxylesterase